jgi:muramoyltetrapeptide carboxypeptidase
MAEDLKPSVLRKGDTIGLFAPAGPLATPDVLSEGAEIIQKTGFKVTYSDDIYAKNNYLAGSDERRIEEFRRLWLDEEIKALIGVRGGYGSIRLLAGLNMEEVRNHPKVLMGFSDLTVLLNGIQAKTSLVTFHGPMLSTLVRDNKAELSSSSDQTKLMPLRYKAELSSSSDQTKLMPLRSRMSAFGDCLQILTNPIPDNISSPKIQIARPGQASGRIMGGNLTNLVHLLGTDFEPDWHGAILFLEDIHEPAYKIDRMLTQLKLSGRLDLVSGILLGGFLTKRCEEIADMPLVIERVIELTKSHVPIWTHFPASHGPENRIIPIGISAAMDSASKTISFAESFLQG